MWINNVWKGFPAWKALCQPDGFGWHCFDGKGSLAGLETHVLTIEVPKREEKDLMLHPRWTQWIQNQWHRMEQHVWESPAALGLQKTQNKAPEDVNGTCTFWRHPRKSSVQNAVPLESPECPWRTGKYRNGLDSRGLETSVLAGTGERRCVWLGDLWTQETNGSASSMGPSSGRCHLHPRWHFALVNGLTQTFLCRPAEKRSTKISSNCSKWEGWKNP